MNQLSNFADAVEDMAKMDFNDQPSVMFRNALWNAVDIPVNVARETVIKMEVNIYEFDYTNPEWVRIVKAYAVVLKKIYDIYGSNMVHLSPMSITWNE